MSAAVAAARAWIGTPYRHQASVRGAGADCLGLVRGVFRDLHGTEPAPVPAYTPCWGEVDGEELLWRAARDLLVPAEAHPGAVILFRMREGAIAKHLGVLTVPGRAFVHAYERHGVVESPLSAPWARRIVQHFAFPAT
ncbi:MAG: NlpC/P60 family protein [Shimia sp.]